MLGRQGLRTAGERAGVDRKTARRHVDAAVAAGVVRDGGVAQLSDELIGAVAAAVRPVRRAGHGQAWEALVVEETRIQDWIVRDSDRLQLTNIHGKLTRCGVEVPYRTLHGFATERCGFGRRQPTVRVADGEPGVECQVDFGRLGLVPDPETERRRQGVARCSAGRPASPATPASSKQAGDEPDQPRDERPRDDRRLPR